MIPAIVPLTTVLSTVFIDFSAPSTSVIILKISFVVVSVLRNVDTLAMAFAIYETACVAVSIRQRLNTLPAVYVILPSTFVKDARPGTALDPITAALVVLPLALISFFVGPGKCSFAFLFSIHPLAIVPNISVLTNERAVAMLVVFLPLTYVLCSVALTPCAFSVFISILPLAIVLDNELVLPFTPNSTSALPMLHTVLPFSSVLRTISVSEYANPVMLIEFPFSFVTLARASCFFAIATSLIFEPVTSVSCAIAIILRAKAVFFVILPGTIVNMTVSACQHTLTEPDAFWRSVTSVLIAILVNDSVNKRLLGENS